MWDSGWDTIFTNNEWGKYPPEEVIRFVARNFAKTRHQDIKILEVGCGTGANLWYVSREGYQAFGVDGSEVALGRARSRFEQEGLTVQLFQGDVMQLPFEDEFFDAVLDVECIYANTMKDSHKIIKEVERVLKPQGLFFSKTFMTGTYGDGNGEKVEGERNTYKEITEGALHKGYGVIRFSDEEDIQELYAPFTILEMDYLTRSQKNRSNEVKEWLITCQKQ